MDPNGEALQDVARAAVAIPGIVSAVIFTRQSGATGLQLAAAAGIDGEPLRRLSAAVLDPSHPIARTLREATPSFDVLPTAPGGPALRSHVPIVVTGDGAPACVGVLAVAHDRSLDEPARGALVDLAQRAART